MKQYTSEDRNERTADLVKDTFDAGTKTLEAILHETEKSINRPHPVSRGIGWERWYKAQQGIDGWLFHCR